MSDSKLEKVADYLNEISSKMNQYIKDNCQWN